MKRKSVLAIILLLVLSLVLPLTVLGDGAYSREVEIIMIDATSGPTDGNSLGHYTQTVYFGTNIIYAPPTPSGYYLISGPSSTTVTMDEYGNVDCEAIVYEYWNSSVPYDLPPEHGPDSSSSSNQQSGGSSSNRTGQQSGGSTNRSNQGNASNQNNQNRSSSDWWTVSGNTSGHFSTISITGTSVSLNRLQSDSDRHQSFFGPGKRYPGAGAYKPKQATKVTALFKEGDFVYVDMLYTTVGRRCLYFPSYVLSNRNIPELDLYSLLEFGTVTQNYQPRFGPGNEYNGVVQKQNGRQDDVIVPAGTGLDVFFEANGWVFAEFDCVLGTIRAWFPSNIVSLGR